MTERAHQPTPPLKRPLWRRWGVEVLIFLCGVLALQMWQLRDAARGPAPDFALNDLAGQQVTLADWRKLQPEKPRLLYFWAEWCPVCRTTAGSVSAIAADWPVLSVAVQSGSESAVAKVMQDKGYSWPTINDPRGQMLQRYGLPGTPAFAILTPDGQIRHVAVGYTSEIGLRLRLWLAGL